LNGKPVVTLLLENPFEKGLFRSFSKLLWFYYHLKTYVFQAKESIIEKFLPGFFQKPTFNLT